MANSKPIGVCEANEEGRVANREVATGFFLEANFQEQLCRPLQILATPMRD